MNKYIEKIAAELSDENKRVAKTFAVQTAAGVPAHAIGSIAGGAIGMKHLAGAAGGINRGAAGLAGKLGSAGKIGKAVAGKLSKVKVSGGSLGVVAGMSAVGALADLAALKHGMHKKD